MPVILDERLLSAASFVREGARFADIGSDHAYLPIYLCQTQKTQYALASDINEGPVMRAKQNIALHSLSDRICAVRSDGLDFAREYAPDDIAILGMGGELMISIIEAAEWVRDPKIRLILQPMTHAELVYEYLLSQGFCVCGEDIVSVSQSGERERLYRIICAEYDGKKRSCTSAEAYVGALNLAKMSELTRKYAEQIINIMNIRINGKTAGGQDAEFELSLVEALRNFLEGGTEK